MSTAWRPTARSIVAALGLITVLAGSATSASAALIWPGSAAVAVADDTGVFGGNLSGLAYQPSGTSARGVLWAVRNGPSTLFRLIYDGGRWTPDPANGWAAGKTLLYPDGSGVPDAEGVTLAGGDASGIFVSTERNDTAGLSNTSRPAVLRFDVTAPGAALTATKDWNLTADLPGLGANLGLEAVAWVPDTLLVAKGFKDEVSGTTYDPAAHPGHGAGLFFVGIEANGLIVAYALNQTTGAFARVATIASGFPKVMDLVYEPESTHLWAVCDDSCNGRTATLDIAASGPSAGRFVVTNTYERPTGMPNINNEGFTFAPQAECVAGFKPVFWADDSNTDSHAVRSGALNCTVPPPTDLPATTPPAGDPPATTPPVSTPAPQVTTFRPVLTGLAAKIRPSGKGTVKLKLACERVDAALSAPQTCDGSVRLTAKLGGKKKTIATAPFSLAGGQATTVSVTLSSAAKKALKKSSLKVSVIALVGTIEVTQAVQLRSAR